MRTWLCLLSVVGIVLLSGVVHAAPATQPVGVAFETHSGYFVSNKFEPQAAASFVVLTDQKAFDEVFGTARVMGDRSHRLGADAFDTRLVVAAIKRGKAVVEFTVGSVTVEAGVLSVHYTTASMKQGSAEFACPLIVSVPKEAFAAVEFVEDGKSVRKIDLKVPATQQARSKTSMKGWELYVFAEKDQTRFALLEGTNRLKSDDEIVGAAVASVDAIKAQLDELEKGQSVAVVGRALGDRPANGAADAVVEYCNKIGLDVLK